MSSKISFKEIISYMPGTVYWMGLDHVYLGCNLNLARILKKNSPDEVIGATIYDLTPDKVVADFIHQIDHQVMQYDKEIALEENAFDANGHPAVYFTKKQPLHDDQGNVVGMLGVSIDITDRKRAEEAAIKAKEMAEAANKVKTEFLASMTHDVKTPLSGMIGITELLASRAKNKDDKKLLGDLHESGKELMSFFEGCIELSKMDMATLQEISQPFSLKKIANAIYVLFTPSATEKHLLLSVNVDKKLPSVLFGNQISIYRVILNLVGNAIKFTQQGSVNLTVKMQEQIDKDHVLVNILVRDTGIGIPEEKHQIIFDKLERLAPSYSEGQKGHGIGLYIVDQYVKAMNGRIKVESTLEKGSCFTVTLPLKVLKKNQDEIIHFPERIKKPRSRKRAATFSQGIVSASVVLEENAPIILLVEDHPMIQEMTHTILKSVGAHVDIASTGQEALELFSTKKYTVIYMDIGLPDMGGYDVARCLRAIEKEQNKEHTPIIALSAHATIDIQRFCGDAKMDGVMSKPLSVRQAQQVLDYYMSKRSIVIDGFFPVDNRGEL